MDLDDDIALVTLDEAKEYLKIDSGNTDSDEILGLLINGISAWVAGHLGRGLIKDTHTEYYDGDGSRELILNRRPIISVTSIHDDINRDFEDVSLVDSDSLIVLKEKGIVRAFNLYGGFTCGEANIKVVYVAGYENGVSVPNDIKLAVLRTLDHHWRNGYTHRKLDVSSETVGDVTTTFRDGDIPADAKAMLRPYKEFLASPQFAYAD